MKLCTPIRASRSQGPHITFQGPWSAEDRALLSDILSPRRPTAQPNAIWTLIVLPDTHRPIYVATRSMPALETFSARSLEDLIGQMRL